MALQRLFQYSGTLLATLIAFTLPGCGADDSGRLTSIDWDAAPRVRQIVNGETTDYQSFQGVVAIYGADTHTLCTGTLIDPQVVLTAGHCVYDPSQEVDYRESPSRLWIYGGADILDVSARIFYTSVAEVHVHHDWDEDPSLLFSPDLALLKLKEPIDGVEPYRVREAPHTQVGDGGIIVGYGLASSDDMHSAGVHRQGASDTLQVYVEVLEVGMPSGTCNGDSGGPYFTWQNEQWVVTGVTSFGTTETCRSEDDGWEVNVLSYRGWIEDVFYELTDQELPGGAPDTDSTAANEDEFGLLSNPENETDTSGDSETDTDTDTHTDTVTDTDSDSDTDGETIGAGGSDTDSDSESSLPDDLSEQEDDTPAPTDIPTGASPASPLPERAETRPTFTDGIPEGRGLDSGGCSLVGHDARRTRSFTLQLLKVLLER